MTLSKKKLQTLSLIWQLHNLALTYALYFGVFITKTAMLKQRSTRSPPRICVCISFIKSKDCEDVLLGTRIQM